jgi:hypothetical protein
MEVFVRQIRNHVRTRARVQMDIQDKIVPHVTIYKDIFLNLILI